MRLELCHQLYSQPSCYVGYDGSVWFLKQGEGGRDIALDRSSMHALCAWLTHLLQYEIRTDRDDLFQGAADVSLTIPRRSARGVPDQISLVAQLEPDRTGESWAVVVLEQRGITVRFDIDEAQFLIALWNGLGLWEKIVSFICKQVYRKKGAPPAGVGGHA